MEHNIGMGSRFKYGCLEKMISNMQSKARKEILSVLVFEKAIWTEETFNEFTCA